MISKKLTLAQASDGTISVASQAAVQVVDYFTTLISTDTVLTGTAALIQKAGLSVASMAVASKLTSNDYFAFARRR